MTDEIKSMEKLSGAQIVAIAFLVCSILAVVAVLIWHTLKNVGTTSGANSSPNPPPEPVPGPSRLPSSLSATGYYLDRGHPDPIRVDDGAFANVGHNSKDNVKLVNGYGHFAWSEDASIMVEVINRFGPNVNTVVSVNGTDTTVQCNHVVMAYTQNTKVDYLKWEPAFSDFSKLKGEPTTTTPEVVESIDSWGTLSRSSVAVSKQGTSFSVTHVLGSAVGTVYVYTKNASGNFVLDMTDPSRQETSTLNFNSQNNDYFGRTMQWYSDDALAVSAVVDNSQSTGQGTINFYERNNGATSLNHSFAEAFTPITLTSATPEFGNVFACNANAESLVAADTNKLHVYSRRLQDKAFAKKQSIDVSGNASSMALSEPPLILIAGYEETENVHVYTRPDTDSDFKLKQTISAPAVLGNHFGGVRRFGHTAKMSIDGRMMIVGCNAGASATGGNITSDAVTSGMYLYRWDGDAEQYKTDTPPQYIPRRVGGSTYVHVAGRIPEAKIIAGDPDGANLMVYKQNV